MSKRFGLVACGLFLVACGDASPPTDPSPVDPAGPDATPLDRARDGPHRVDRCARERADGAVGRSRGRGARGPADGARGCGALAPRTVRLVYRLSAAQVAGLELLDLHDTGRGAIIARFARRIDGIEVFGERLSVAMDRNLDVVALTGYVTGDLPGSIELRPGEGPVPASMRSKTN